MGYTIGEKIKELREQSGLSTRELSNMVQKGSAYISQIERGVIKKPKMRTIIKILEALGCSENEIYEIMTNTGYHLVAVNNRITAVDKSATDTVISHSHSGKTFPNLTWIESKIDKLKTCNKENFGILNHFIEMDVSRAETVITHTNALLKDMNLFELYIQLLSIDYRKIGTNKRRSLLDYINKLKEYEDD